MHTRDSEAGQIWRLFQDHSPGAGRRRYVIDSREQLQVEITCKPIPYSFQNSTHKYMYGIDLRLGQNRLYVVQRIRALLDAIERDEPYELTRNFTYDPELHSFAPAIDAVVRCLIEIYRNERMYRETSALYSGYVTNRVSGDKSLLIPPLAWEGLLQLLIRASAAGAVKLDVDGIVYTGIQLSDEPIPVHYEFGEAEQADGNSKNGYRLRVYGLDQLIVMDAYQQIISGGKILQLSASKSRQLAELQAILSRSDSDEIQIPEQQMSPFMDQVLPGLMKLGDVQMTETISQRILRVELQASMYLDRVRNRLLVGLDFQYGDIVINPLEPEDHRRGEQRILIRDGEREALILELIEQSPFVKTEGGYFMEDEDEEYVFLYQVLPQLEKLLRVYATSAVKLRLAGGGLQPPKVIVEVDERTDWLEVKFQMEGIPEADIRKILQALEEKRKYYRMPSGAFLPLETEAFQDIIRFMNEVGIRKADLGIERGSGGRLQLPLARGMGLDLSDSDQTVKLGKTLRRLLDDIRHPDSLSFPVPEQLDNVLRDYQRYGYQWLRTLAQYRFGGILADDMGLGKTLQAISFLAAKLPEIRATGMPALIVAPSSLMYNWCNEFRKFTPDIRVVLTDGTPAQRREAWKQSAQADVIITSYPLLRMDSALVVEREFHTLILDEAQYFKNYTTQTARAVRLVEARYRFALSGTPIENRLEELWSIYSVVFPELFPDGRQAFLDLSREQVSARIRPFLLRRLKSDVLSELPEKIETVQASELLPEQKKLYVAYLAKLQQETLKHLDKDTRDQHRIKMLAGLTRLRQICCHPALFSEGYTGSSAKLQQLLEIIEECRSAGRRVLIFSQFTQMLGMIRRELGVLGVPFFYLDGQTPAAERVQLCDRFNDGERELFLISLKAGGTGLNLTGADTVILYDLWWNPAVEQQAADRAHRIGQKKVVQVIRLIAQGTIEEKMIELQQRKIDLIDEVIESGQGLLSSLTEDDLRELLGIG